jgi:hypothetical protein
MILFFMPTWRDRSVAKHSEEARVQNLDAPRLKEAGEENIGVIYFVSG